MTNNTMEDISDSMQKRIDRLLESQGLGVLATKDENGQPYASLIAFAPNADKSELYFVTPKATRKHANLMHDPRVALLINDSGNSPSDFHQAIAVTALGQARSMDDTQKSHTLSVYLNKHPYLRQFAQSPSCAMFSIKVSGFTMVQQFQNVSELRLDHDLDPDT